MPEYVAWKLPAVTAAAIRQQPLTVVSAAIPGTIQTGYSSGGTGAGVGSNLLLYGGIALLLALAAGGGYYYWFHMRKTKE